MWCGRYRPEPKDIAQAVHRRSGEGAHSAGISGEIVSLNASNSSAIENHQSWHPVLELSAQEVFETMLGSHLEAVSEPLPRRFWMSPPWWDWRACCAES